MNPFKIMGYFALIGISLLAAAWATRNDRPGRIEEDPDELGYRWVEDEFPASNDDQT